MKACLNHRCWILLFGVMLAAGVTRPADGPRRSVNAYGVVPSEHHAPSQLSREPLVAAGKPVQEGRNIILDCDSYPRMPGRLLNDVVVSREGQFYRIGFTLDRYDDVLVRVVDGVKAVRTLACGVLGPNAPSPLAKGSLKQELLWDGKDAAGQCVPVGCKLEVAVGLTPRFERFIGHDPAQLTRYVCGLEVDPQGRVYVALHTEQEGDPVLLRFSPEGKYLDMVYPPSPQALAGRKLEEVYEHAESIDGRAVPTRRVPWPFWIDRKGQQRIVPFPFRVDPAGRAWMAEITTGYGGFYWTDEEMSYRIFPVENLDRFWFLQNMAMYPFNAAFAVDREGFAYLATKTSSSGGMFYWPDFRGAINDLRAPGTIRKVELKTGKFAKHFHVSEQRYIAYLGIPQIVDDRFKSLDKTEPQPEFDGPDRFIDIQDMAIDERGRLLVIDGYPRRIKIYSKSAGKWPEGGQFIGEIAEMTLQGKNRRFCDLRSIRAATGGFFAITSFRGEDQPSLYLVKCEGDYSTAEKKNVNRNGAWVVDAPITTVRVAWSVRLDPAARFLAVDERTARRLIWVGNGGGEATITRVEDLGDKPGEVRHIGGVSRHAFPHPLSIAAASEERLYVYDHERNRIIATDGGNWEEAAETLAIEEGNHRNPRPYLRFDRVNRRLLVTSSVASQRFACYNEDLTRAKGFDLEQVSVAAGADKQARSYFKSRAGHIGHVDQQGNLYAADYPADGSKGGVVRRYGSDGHITSPALCRLHFPSSAVATDSRGCIYVFDLPDLSWRGFVHNYPVSFETGPQHPRPVLFRGDRPVWQHSEIGYLVKFGPGGGVRGSEDELWAHRGVSPQSGIECSCNWPRQMLSIDGADRIFAADWVHYQVKVLDTAGNLIGRVGTWGNAQTVPEARGNAAEVGFWNIFSLDAVGDVLYVCDKDLRRIAKFRMEYREMKTVAVPEGASLQEAPHP